MIEIKLDDIIDKGEKRVAVKATSTRRAHYRTIKEGKESNKELKNVKAAIDKAQAGGDALKDKMNNMIDKYYNDEDISAKNKKKIDDVEAQMKGVYEVVSSMRKKYEAMATGK